MALEVCDVDVAYGPKRVVHGVSLAVQMGEIVALIGHNGAGKTTLLRAIMGLLPLQRGQVLYAGRPARRPAEIIRQGVSYCPQGGEVFRSLTVEENLALAAYQLRNRELELRNRAAVFELFPVLLERRRQLAGTLSGGERQQLAIGMALMTSPKVLLLDEPSGGLAPMVVEKVFESIRQINQQWGAAILLVEQNLRQAFALAQRVYALRNGRVVYHGTPGELERDASLREALLGF
ncbi:MAG TPA: ABC transporter ATP-binding protein [Chloroflexota bacterium]|nr:ABC transporter ATP-binding protein [Chloroflexota bacterium]